MDKSFEHTAQRIMVEGFKNNFYQLRKKYDKLNSIFDEIENHINKDEVDERIIELICHSRHYSKLMSGVYLDLADILHIMSKINEDFTNK